MRASIKQNSLLGAIALACSAGGCVSEHLRGKLVLRNLQESNSVEIDITQQDMHDGDLEDRIAGFDPTSFDYLLSPQPRSATSPGPDNSGSFVPQDTMDPALDPDAGYGKLETMGRISGLIGDLASQEHGNLINADDHDGDITDRIEGYNPIQVLNLPQSRSGSLLKPDNSGGVQITDTMDPALNPNAGYDELPKIGRTGGLIGDTASQEHNSLVNADFHDGDITERVAGYNPVQVLNLAQSRSGTLLTPDNSGGIVPDDTMDTALDPNAGYEKLPTIGRTSGLIGNLETMAFNSLVYSEQHDMDEGEIVSDTLDLSLLDYGEDIFSGTPKSN